MVKKVDQVQKGGKNHQGQVGKHWNSGMDSDKSHRRQRGQGAAFYKPGGLSWRNPKKTEKLGEGCTMPWGVGGRFRISLTCRCQKIESKDETEGLLKEGGVRCGSAIHSHSNKQNAELHKFNSRVRLCLRKPP